MGCVILICSLKFSKIVYFQDKQLVEMIDAAALGVIKGSQVNKSCSRYQSFTVFLRGKPAFLIATPGASFGFHFY